MRWLVRLVGLILTLVVVAVAAVALIPAEQIAGLATRQLQATTGRIVQISGAVRPTVWPEIGVTTGPLTIANADWSDEGPLLSADGLSIGLDLRAALSGQVVIRSMALTNPALILERRADGTGNWTLAPEAAPSDIAAPEADPTNAAEAGGGLPSFTLDRGTITGGRLTWIDHASGQRLSASDIAASLTLPQAAGPADVQLSASLGGQPFALTAHLPEVASLASGKVAPVELRLSVGGRGLDLGLSSGRAGLTGPEFDGSLTLDLTSGDGLAALLQTLAGQTAPDLPLPLTLAAKATLTPEGSAHLRQAKLGLGPNQLSADADLFTDATLPKLVARIRAGALDLGALLPAASAGAGSNAGSTAGGSAAPGWSQAPIDASALALLDADVSLAADSLRFGAYSAEQVDLALHLDRGRAVTDIAQLQLFGGSIAGQFVVNARKGLSMGGKLKLTGIDLRQALQSSGLTSKVSGTGNAAVQFLAGGETVDSLIRGLSGEGTLDLGQGTLEGLDLEAVLTSLNPEAIGRGNTIFDRVSASFVIDKGVLSNQDLVLAAPLLTATGKGLVDLGNRSLDYLVTPTLSAQGKALSVPVRLSGPWSNLSIRPDLQDMIDAKLAEETARLKAEAEAKLAAEAARLKAEAQAKLAAEAAKLGIEGPAGREPGGSRQAHRPAKRPKPRRQRPWPTLSPRQKRRTRTQRRHPRLKTC